MTGRSNGDRRLLCRIMVQKGEDLEDATLRIREKVDKALMYYPDRLTYKEYKETGSGENYLE